MTIEHRVVIGLITSTEYLQQIAPLWDPRYLVGPGSKTLAIWCMEYYNSYNKAPGKEIWNIYFTKKDRLGEGLAEDIEMDILPGLSDKHEEEPFNLQYLLEQTNLYFTRRSLEIHADEINGYLLDDNLIEAENLASSYKPPAQDIANVVDFKDEKSLDKVEKAFNGSGENLIEYPRQLGKFWNSQLRRSAFVALMSIEKRGKTFWLMDMAVRAASQKRKIAFFQAGDMTEDEQIMRICIHITGRSNLEQYSGKMWEPERDCIYNQLDTCDKEERQVDFGAFGEYTEKQLRQEICREKILEARLNYPEYKTCHNCDEYWNKRGYGSVWLKRISTGSPLTLEEAKNTFRKTFTNKGNLRLSTHINGSLTVKNIKSILDIWEKQHNFVADVIIIDYADLLVTEYNTDFRHQQNEIWKALRGLSQERCALVVTATQSDAKGYDSSRLRMSNFSEDKRKYGHVTAMYGLNQDKDGREKELGIMRINEIVKREGAFSEATEITVLQNLRRGRPFLYSYF